jgi:hypothetical protein
MVVEFLNRAGKALRVMTPPAGEWAPLEKECYTHSGAVVNRVTFDIKKERHPTGC